MLAKGWSEATTLGHSMNNTYPKGVFHRLRKGLRHLEGYDGIPSGFGPMVGRVQGSRCAPTLR
jgi:hypothetical protein